MTSGEAMEKSCVIWLQLGTLLQHFAIYTIYNTIAPCYLGN